MQHLSDADLIDRFCRGQIHAFNLLVSRWQKPIFNFLYRYLGNVEDAEDACQKTFVKAYRKLSHLKETASFRAWLFQVAANQGRDALRARKRSKILNFGFNNDDHHEDEIPRDVAEQMDASVHQQQLRQIFECAMKQIPEEQRIVIVLKIYQGLKFIEISEVLDEPVNTVKSRMYYGLRTLRKVLEKQDYDEEVLRYEM